VSRSATNPTPPVDCRYGAPMGRAAREGYIVTINSRPMYLVRCPLDSGGYDAGGAYWGLGEPLYYYAAQPEGLIDGYVRGRTREKAKEAVRKLHPHARFFR
jgi:hypothetical protein